MDDKSPPSFLKLARRAPWCRSVSGALGHGFLGRPAPRGLGVYWDRPSVKPAAVDALLRVKGPGHVLVVLCAARRTGSNGPPTPFGGTHTRHRAPDIGPAPGLRYSRVSGCRTACSSAGKPKPGVAGAGAGAGPGAGTERNPEAPPTAAGVAAEPARLVTDHVGARKAPPALSSEISLYRVAVFISLPFRLTAGQHVSHQRPGFTPVGSQPAGTVGRSQSPSPSHFWPPAVT